MIQKISLRAAIISLILVLFLTSPGIFIVFSYHRDIFLEIDAWKLLLLSLSIVTPFFLTSLIAIGGIVDAADEAGDQDTKNLVTISFSIFATAVCLYVSSLIVYVFKRPETFSELIKIAIFVQIFILLITGMIELGGKKSKTKEKQN